jgi:hypothetical protein
MELYTKMKREDTSKVGENKLRLSRETAKRPIDASNSRLILVRKQEQSALSTFNVSRDKMARIERHAECDGRA